MDISFVIEAEANAIVSIERKTGGAYVSGKWVPADPAIQNDVPVVIQPTSGRELRDLPEGLRIEAKYSLWSLGSLALNDVIVYAGKRYRVIFLWERPEGSFTKAALGLIT